MVTVLCTESWRTNWDLPVIPAVSNLFRHLENLLGFEHNEHLYKTEFSGIFICFSEIKRNLDI